MKKYLLLLASAAMLLVGCAKEKLSIESGADEMVTATFTAQMQSAPQTKAVTDGGGTKANRCVMEIYYGGVLYLRDVQSVDSGMKATFTPTLVSNRTYDVLFWADCGDGLADKYYTTDADGLGLQAVEMMATSYAANDDARDAFFSHEENVVVGQQVSSETFTLTRPFSQVNIITTDAAIIKNANLYPDGVKMVYTAPTKFNLLSGELSEAKVLTVTGAPYETFNASSAALTLEMDYLFAGLEKSALDIAFEASKTGESAVTSHSFTNIPVQRNYRTNIKGALLTTTGNWVAEIVPTWSGNGTGDEDPWIVNYVEAGSIAAANEALKTSNAVSIENPSDLGDPIIIPAEQDGKNVFITVTGASTGDIVVKKVEAEEGPATLDIESDSKNLNIDLPNSHVDLNKGNFTGVTSNTSATTLVVGKDVVIETLTINGGNAEIYGLVNTISKQASTVVDFYVGTAAGLRSVAEKISAAPQNKDFYGKVYLTADIDLNSEEWTPIAAFQKPLTIEGNGYTIKNLKVTESTIDYIGFIGTACGLTVKNLNFDTVILSYPSTVGENARGGVIAGHVWGATIENCTVKNVEITACQKVGGLLGYIEGDTNVPHTIKNCSVENVSIKSNDPAKILQHGAGGFIGHISLNQNPLISISGCSVKDITIADFGTASYTSSELQRIPHVFIGNVCNTYTGTEVVDIASHSVVLSNNTISGNNTVLPTCVYSSEYFGWAGNAEERPAWKGGIYIDGQEWTPNYPVKIVGGKGYATLAEALAAATEGQTVQILKAGEYTFPGNTKKAIIVEGLDEKGADGNYVAAINLNGVSGYNENLTFKHLTFNFTNSEGSDRGFTHCVNMTYNECAFTGLMWGYDSQVSTFNDCLFHQATKYNVWSYGGNLEFNRCTFESNGNFVNVYATNACGNISEVKAVDCKFVNKNSSAVKAAFNIKGKVGTYVQHTHVVIENCTTEGLFPNSSKSTESTIYSDDGLWMFDDGPWEDAVYAKVDGVTYYPYFTIDANGNYSVKNATGLKMAIKHWNALKAAGEKSITLADGTYNVSDMAIFQNYANKSLLIKAENEKQAVITPTAGSKQLIFVVAGMSKSYAGHITIDGIKFDMSDASNKNIESDVISISDAVGTNLPADEKALYPGTYHYGHDITIKNCEIIGFGDIENSAPENGSEHCSVARADGSNGNGYNVKVQNCIIDKMGYVLTSKITTLAEVSNCTITNTKCVINNTSDGTEYKVINNSISTYHDYCIRVNFGPLTVSGNTFNCTYSGDATDAGAVVLRGSTGNEATITGNTFNKAVGTMYDVYCKTSWNVNGETISANTGKNL